MSNTEPTAAIETAAIETEAIETEAIAAPAEETLTDVALPRPRIRWGALVWGLLVIAAVAWTLSIAGSPAARDSFVRWFTGLTPGGWIIVGVFVVGGFILVRGLVAVLKLTQRSRD